ncbi:MAG: hypothetical protein ACR2KO_11995 [Geodermatophilaceae bacterium]
MRNILRGGGGFAPLVLVIVVVWALLAVIFLTGTLLAARSIDRSVNTAKTGINPQVGEIGKDAKFIDQARTIASTSGKILTAAKPLSGQLDQINRTAREGIDPKLKSVLGQVNKITEVAGSINTNVLQIGSTVGAIQGNAGSINASVGSINGRARSILGRARSINTSVDSIDGNARGILSRVVSIDSKAATINRNAITIKASADPIATDLNDVLKLVGRENTEKTPGTILFHANSIDCSPFVNSPNSVLPGLLTTVSGLTAALTTLLGGPPPATVPAGGSNACVP